MTERQVPPDSTPPGDDPDQTGVRPEGTRVPERVKPDTDDDTGDSVGVLVRAPAFRQFAVRNLTITAAGTRVPKSRLAEVRNTAERLGLTIREG